MPPASASPQIVGGVRRQWRDLGGGDVVRRRRRLGGGDVVRRSRRTAAETPYVVNTKVLC